MAVQRQTYSWRVRVGKWMGLVLGVLAVLVDQQVASITIYARCPQQHSTAFVVGLGVVCSVVALAGALISAHVRRMLPADESLADPFSRTDRFIATISMVFALTVLLVIVFGTAASLFLGCER